MMLVFVYQFVNNLSIILYFCILSAPLTSSLFLWQKKNLQLMSEQLLHIFFWPLGRKLNIDKKHRLQVNISALLVHFAFVQWMKITHETSSKSTNMLIEFWEHIKMWMTSIVRVTELLILFYYIALQCRW